MSVCIHVCTCVRMYVCTHVWCSKVLRCSVCNQQAQRYNLAGTVCGSRASALVYYLPSSGHLLSAELPFVSFTWSQNNCPDWFQLFHSDVDRNVHVSKRSVWRHVRTSIIDLVTSKRNNIGMDTSGRQLEVCGRLRQSVFEGMHVRVRIYIYMYIYIYIYIYSPNSACACGFLFIL